MEVVVLCVADEGKGDNGVDEGCNPVQYNPISLLFLVLLTLGGGILAKVGLLVTSEEALGLGLGSWAAGELRVEVHDLLHAHGIGRGADSLDSMSAKAQTPLAHVE
jgi:hypothetical protein